MSAWIALLMAWSLSIEAQEPPPLASITNGFIIQAYKGSVVIQAYLHDDEVPVQKAGQFLTIGDSLRTLTQSGATVVNAAAGVGIDQNTRIAVEGERVLRAERGTVFFKSLGPISDDGLVVLLPGGKALAHGTEFAIHIDPVTGQSTLTVLEGSVTLTNTLLNAGLKVDSSQPFVEATMSSNQAPVLTTSRLDVTSLGHVIQWMLYYPGVVYLGDLGAAVTNVSEIQASVNAYRLGNLPAALTNYPAGRQPTSGLETVYRAALLLSAGQVSDCQSMLGSLPESTGEPSTEERLRHALRQVIAAVTGRPEGHRLEPKLASEWLAESYYLQARGGTNRLNRALDAATQAVKVADDFGFAWAQKAELEFSFRHNEAAEQSITRALGLVPENAQAYTVQGFLFAGRNQLPKALHSFERAVALDPGLGNAWLGRGLVRIRQGDSAGGLSDLQVAVTQEPTRALLRSYLAKAYYLAGNLPRARSELAAAAKLDQGDPTPLLYTALIDAQENRLNAAVRELEQSQALNENRAVYRSGLLLDEDQAVRGANLAAIYRDVGLRDVGVREASRAVSYDYANAAAHLFLASSYDALRDPRGITLRYETPWQNELLLANLLSPAAAGTYSQSVSQQEYSRLFERDQLSVFSQGSYFSNGDWLAAGSQYGIVGNSSYSVDVQYLNIDGWRTNEFEQNLSVTAKFKQQLTQKDNLFLELVYSHVESGDLIQYYNNYNPTNNQPYYHPDLRYLETQLPIALMGYHREWSPQSHTLFLAVRAEDTLNVTDPAWSTLTRNTNNVPPTLGTLTNQLNYESQLVLYSLEAQQIWRTDDGRFTTIFGGRYQWGGFDTTAVLSRPKPLPPYSADQVNSDLQRGTFYVYQTAEPVRNLQLTAGLAYDNLTYPENHRTPPLFDEQQNLSQWSPKAGFIWTPLPTTHVRGGYAQSVGGVSFDQSFRLEPNQVAGFIQSFRSLIPESVAGSIVAPTFDTWGVSFDHRFPTGTYIGLEAGWLQSDASQALGGLNTLITVTTNRFGIQTNVSYIPPITIHSDINFRERNFLATVNQLLGEEWSVGAVYRLSDANLEQTFYNPLINYQPSALLQSLDLSLLFNHHSGFFAGFDSLWFHQNNDDPANPSQTGDTFWQCNLVAGWRFLQRRLEISAGILNLTAEDYHLSPLNLIPYLPRDRVYVGALKLNF